MREIRESLERIQRVSFDLGYVGEKNHTRVVIICASMFEKHPDAVATMVAKPPVGDLYPIVLTRDNNCLVWDVSESDLAYAGSGTYQLTFTEDEEVIKTEFGAYFVKASMEATGEPPEPIEDWLQEAQDTLADLESLKDISESASDSDIGKALSPKTVSNGKVTEWQYISGGGADIDDTSTALNKVWSAHKIDAEVKDLKSAINTLELDDSLLFSELPGTSTTVTMDSNGNPTSIVHTANSATVRTDAFVWGTGTVTETRTLANGKYITITTNLDTLAQTISAVQEVA